MSNELYNTINALEHENGELYERIDELEQENRLLKNEERHVNFENPNAVREITDNQTPFETDQDTKDWVFRMIERDGENADLMFDG